MTQRLNPSYDNYTVLRTCAALVDLEVQLPPPAALLAFLSQALLAFEQWTDWLGRARPRPATAAAEVLYHSYRVTPTGGVALEYATLTKRPGWREGVAPKPGSPDFHMEQYGAQLYKAKAVAPLFGLPADDITAAGGHDGHGMEPLVTVPAALAVAAGTVLYGSDMRALRNFSGRYANKEEYGASLADIVVNTIQQVRCSPM